MFIEYHEWGIISDSSTSMESKNAWYNVELWNLFLSDSLALKKKNKKNFFFGDC